MKLFQANTQEGIQLKLVGEVIADLKVACFRVNGEGITLRQFDKTDRHLFDLELVGENFKYYEFLDDTPRNIGITTSYLNRILKATRKDCSMTMYYTDEAPDQFCVGVVPKEVARYTISGVKIQNIQQLDILLPSGYGKPIIVASNEFQKTIKEQKPLCNKMVVMAYKSLVRFKCDEDSVYFKTVEFGELPEDDEFFGRRDEDDIPWDYIKTFSMDQFVKIMRICVMGKALKLYATEGLPLKLETNVGSIGRIAVYMKSKEDLDAEQDLGKEED
jgi:hypothetical protein